MNIKSLIDRKESLSGELTKVAAEIEAIRRNCSHSWGVAEYIPRRIEGYTIRGDPPGTMGVDWCGPTYVEPQTLRRWRRVCSKCLLEQITCRKKLRSLEEMPDFD